MTNNANHQLISNINTTEDICSDNETQTQSVSIESSPTSTITYFSPLNDAELLSSLHNKEDAELLLALNNCKQDNISMPELHQQDFSNNILNNEQEILQLQIIIADQKEIIQKLQKEIEDMKHQLSANFPTLEQSLSFLKKRWVILQRNNSLKDPMKLFKMDKDIKLTMYILTNKYKTNDKVMLSQDTVLYICDNAYQPDIHGCELLQIYTSKYKTNRKHKLCNHCLQ